MAENTGINDPAEEQPTSEPSVEQGGRMVTQNFETAHAESPLEPPASGDFHATFPVNDGTGDIGVVIGDVSGHGPDAAVQAEHIKQEVASKLKAGQSPADVLKNVNGPVEADPEFHGFATVFAGRVDAKTGKVCYASGGHEPGLIAPANSASGEQVEELTRTGPPVGVVPSEEAQYEEKIATLPEGGTLLLYTDGISEARSLARRDWFGVDRLKVLLVRFGNLPVNRLIRRLLANVLTFCGRTMRDDFVLLAIRRHPKPGNVSRPAPAPPRAK